MAELTVAGLWLLAGIFTLVAVMGFAVPVQFTRPNRLEPDNPSALAEVRAAYGGLFGGLAVLFALGARDASIRPTALLIATVVLGVFAVARVVSRAVDGKPNGFSLTMHVVETTGFVLALVLLLQS